MVHSKVKLKTFVHPEPKTILKSTQTNNISCFWISQMGLDLIETVDPKHAFIHFLLVHIETARF